MVKQSGLLLLAAECGRLMDLSVDAKQRQRYKQLRDAWIALAHDRPDLCDETTTDFAACQHGTIH